MAAVDPFVHLHVHTHYSMLDGACRVKDVVGAAKKYNQPAVAITDHGAMHGAVEFYLAAKDAGVKPIIGIEAYLAPTHRTDRTTGPGEGAFHLLLLAQNQVGYRNLLKLSSQSYKDGFYYKPRVDRELLREFNEGIIATSACLGGEVCNALMKHDMQKARRMAEEYTEIFGPDRFFIEVQNNGIPEQTAANPELVDIAKKLGIGVVGTNDVHFLDEKDHFAHNCLCCISIGKPADDETRLKYEPGLFFKNSQQMRDTLADFPEAYDNTRRIADLCELELDLGKTYAPVYKVPDDFDKSIVKTGKPDQGVDEAYLRHLCEEGLKWRYGTSDVEDAVRERLEYEISVIAGKGFASYFLINWDFCNYAREEGIPVGARGSGVGTMVGYLLGLCDVDPVKYDLLFERFMDPSRNEMPDIDIDICMNGRQKVIEYVRNKYGHVAQIITFGTLAAKAAVRDVGRVMNLPLATVDKVCKLIPTAPPGIKIAEAMKKVPELKGLYQQDGQIKEVIDIAQRLEGLCRNAGCHAAGVVIAEQPLDDLVPLYTDKDGNTLTQYEGPIVEKCGLLKMDFLGLRTLTVLRRSVDLVKQTKGIEVDIDHVPLDDQTVLDLFRRGETKGVFQFESGGMQDLLMKMKPDRLEDLIAANALYRPGPMELIPSYCARKHGRESVPKVHPLMDEILDETYGIMVYQEQVMRIFNRLGGIELRAAYSLIKAISKKKSDVIAKFKPQFIDGAAERGLAKDTAEEIFKLILKFGGYGFNKSHSTRYAMVAYQTAYMKVYHPVEYMAALLTFDAGNTEKVVEYIGECGRVLHPDGSRGVDVLPPDVNESDKDFTPVYDTVGRGKNKKTVGTIRFGLSAIRGVGEKAVETVMAERDEGGKFQSVFDFCERVDTRAVGKSTLDALVRCGAFSSIHEKRAPVLLVMDRAFEMGQQTQADKRSGQAALFGTPEPAAGKADESLPAMKELPPSELLAFEKELLGIYLSSHPLNEHQAAVDRYTTANVAEAMQCGEGTEVVIGCMISAVRSKVGKNDGRKWAIIEFEDLSGKIEGMCWADCYEGIEKDYPGAIKKDTIVFARAKVDRRREAPCLIVHDVIPADSAVAKLTTAIKLSLNPLQHTPETLAELKPVLKKFSGGCDVYAQFESDKVCSDVKTLTLRFGGELRVRPTPEFVEEVEHVLGNATVDLIGDGLRRIRRLEQQKLFKEDAPAEVVAENGEGIQDEFEDADADADAEESESLEEVAA